MLESLSFSKTRPAAPWCVRAALALGLAAAVAPAAARAQAGLLLERPAGSGVLLPPLSIAADDSAAAGAVNPAASALGPAALQWVHEEGEAALPAGRRADGLFSTVGGLVAGERSAMALQGSVEWVRPAGGGCGAASPCARRLSLGLAGGGPAFSVGGAWRWLSSGDSRAIDDLSSLDLGFTWRPARWLSVAGVGAQLNAPSSGGVSLPRRYTAALAVRPIGRWATAAVDVTVDDDRWFDRTRVAALLSVSPLDGLDLTAQLAHDPGGAGTLAYMLGVRGGFSTADLDASGGSRPQSGRPGLGTSFSLSAHPALGASLFGRPEVAAGADLEKALEGGGLLQLLLGSGTLDEYTRLLLKLQTAAADPSARVVALEVRGIQGLGLARIQELRAQLLAVRKAGRKVLVWMQGGGDAEYYLASAADRIYVAPQAMIEINGLRSERIYLRRLLDKLGVVPEFEKIGQYKSAPEQFTREDASAPAAEEINAVLEDNYARFVAEVAAGRGVAPERVQALVAEGLLVSERLVELGFADGTSLSGKALEAKITELAGGKLPRRGLGIGPEVARTWGARPAIALVLVKGTIVGGGGNPAQGLVGSDAVVRQVRRAAEDPAVRAIVVRIESGGGDVTASEAMWQALGEAKRKKPVVASMGDIAASGGYYVAAGADEIVAEPGTLTGSIGVFAGKADLSALLAKVGVTTQTFRRGERADMMTLFRPWTEAERGVVRGLVERYYETFLQRVAAGRKMSRDEVDALARGRVWTGAQAKERRLVDALGGLDYALARARARGGLPADAPVTVPGAGGLFEFPDVSVPPTAGGRALEAALAGLLPAAERVLAAPAAERLARALAPGAEAVAPLDALLTLLDGRPLALALDLPVVR